MKKTFTTIVSNKKPERQLDSIKYEIKKYLARERRKPRPDDIAFWDFDCRVGVTEEVAKKINVSEINATISSLVESGNTSFYVEILAKPGKKTKKETSDSSAEKKEV